MRFSALTSHAWLVNALNLICGNLDEVGGSMFTTPAVDILRATALIGQAGHFDKGRSRVRDLPEFNGEYPAATMADEIVTPGESQIRVSAIHRGLQSHPPWWQRGIRH